MLSGEQIRTTIVNEEIAFGGAVRGNSLLLTLGSNLQEFTYGQELVVEPWDENSLIGGYQPAKRGWETYDLPPSRSVLVSAREYLLLSANIAGAIGTLSHVARLGLFAHFASPFIGPRFGGYLCLEILNVSGHILRLKESMPVAKVILFRTEGTDPEKGAEAIPFYYSSSPDQTIDLRSKFFEEFGREFRDENL